VAVDPTGKKFAVAEIGEGVGAKVHIVIASLSQPGKTVSHTEPESTRLLGWTTQGLLLSDTSRSWLWKPGASSEPKIPGVSSAHVIPSDPGRLLVATGQAGAGLCLHLYTLSSRQLGPGLTCGPGADWTVSPDGRRTVFGSTVVDLVNGRVGPELMNSLGFYSRTGRTPHTSSRQSGAQIHRDSRSRPSGSAAMSQPVLASRHPSPARTAHPP